MVRGQKLRATHLLVKGEAMLFKLFLDDPESLRSHAVELRQFRSGDVRELTK